MVVFELAVLLALVAVAAFPRWRHSADWGYGPSATAGVLLLIIMVVAMADKPPDRVSRHSGVPVVKVAAVPGSDHPADR